MKSEKITRVKLSDGGVHLCPALPPPHPRPDSAHHQDPDGGRPTAGLVLAQFQRLAIPLSSTLGSGYMVHVGTSKK